MKGLLPALVTMCAGLAIAAAPAVNDEQEQFELMVSEKLDLEFPKFPVVDVTRKGVVELSYQPQSRMWRLVALRRGFVVISFFSSAVENHPAKVLYVNVRSLPSSSSTDDLMQFCRDFDLDCHPSGKAVQGEVKDARLYYYLQRLCAQRKRCYFAASLALDAREKIAGSIRSLLGDVPAVVEVDAYGSIVVTRQCLDPRAKDSIKGEQIAAFVGASDVIVRCRSPESQNFRVSGTVYLLTSSVAKSLGLEGAWSVPVDSYGVRGLQLSSVLTALEQSSAIEILAEPSLVVGGNRVGRVRSGSEYPLTSRSGKLGDSVVQWKHSGIHLEVTITPRDSQAVLVQYQLKLKARRAGNSLLSQELASHALLRLGVAKIVGWAHLHQDAEQERGTFPSRWPIIGPLFSGSTESLARIRAVFAMRIDRVLEGLQGEPGPKHLLPTSPLP